MKNLIVLTFVSFLFFSSCLPLKEIIPRRSEFFGIDFKKYSDAEFLITPEKFTAEYDMKGIVNYELIPGASYVNTYQIMDIKDPSGRTVREEVKIKKWVNEYVSIYSVLDSIYYKCLDMGADALMNFKFEAISDPHTNILNPITLYGYRVSGYAIKRKPLKIEIR